MALGNNAGKGSARRKGQTAIRIKERRVAKNYTAFNSGPVTARHAIACAGAATGNTFYHNGAAAIPVVNDIVYKTKRARSQNTFVAGFYKLAVGAKGFATMQVNSSGVCIARANCV